MRKIGKRGDVGIGAAVVIVIAVIVLVIAVIGIMGGFNPLWEKIKNFLGGGANVDTVKQACVLACSQDNTYDYCTLERKVKAKDASIPKVTDGKFVDTGGLSKEVTATCAGLAKYAGVLGFEKCPEIEPCPSASVKCAVLTGTWKAACAATEKDVTSEATDTSDRTTATDKCCRLKKTCAALGGTPNATCATAEIDIIAQVEDTGVGLTSTLVKCCK